jgi:hypothetical protein
MDPLSWNFDGWWSLILFLVRYSTLSCLPSLYHSFILFLSIAKHSKKRKNKFIWSLNSLIFLCLMIWSPKINFLSLHPPVPLVSITLSFRTYSWERILILKVKTIKTKELLYFTEEILVILITITYKESWGV